MTYEIMIEKYNRVLGGEWRFELRDLEDIKMIYDIDCKKILGYDTLNKDEKSIYEKCLTLLYNYAGLEKRMKYEPQKVSVVRNENGNREYIRFDYKVNKDKVWMHFLDKGTFY